MQSIHRCEQEYRPLSDEQLQRESLALRYRACSGEPARGLLAEAYALLRQATGRALGMRHFDVQLYGGIALQQRSIAEMQTGEGKTLTAALPLYLAALSGRGAHLATANDYLARRDADWLRPAFALLGISVGVLQSSTPRPQRRQAYECDVTYGAAREFGFDFLRDRLMAGGDEHRRDLLGRMLGQEQLRRVDRLQRELDFILVDEADSILIDEARTPLIVSAAGGTSRTAAATLFRWADRVSDAFQETDFSHDLPRRQLTLTAEGRRKVRELQRPEELASTPLFDLYEHVERALRVAREFERDRHYVLRNGEVVIVDENTGRMAEGRRWRNGIHQAVEAREGLDISPATGEAARVTIQAFVTRYRQLTGMTGTAWSARRELRRIYGLKTLRIPTHKPVRREWWPDAAFATSEEKWAALVDEVAAMHRLGRPVLIGTRTIEQSEALSDHLRAARLDHEVLNARRHAEEAQVVAGAGQAGRVTVATNMAGRGTDIQLGAGVAELGGLHVIGSELHESSRVDRQLMGRCGRQGDPGSFRQFMALEDDLLRAAFGPAKADRLRRRHRRDGHPPSRYARLLRRAQRRLEQQHFQQRQRLLFHERRQRELQLEMGQDPFVECVDDG